MRLFVFIAVMLSLALSAATPSCAAILTHNHQRTAAGGHSPRKLSSPLFSYTSAIPDTEGDETPRKHPGRHSGWRGPTALLLGAIGVLSLAIVPEVAWLPAICAIVVGAQGLRPRKSARLLALIGLLLGVYVLYVLFAMIYL